MRDGSPYNEDCSDEEEWHALEAGHVSHLVVHSEEGANQGDSNGDSDGDMDEPYIATQITDPYSAVLSSTLLGLSNEPVGILRLHRSTDTDSSESYSDRELEICPDTESKAGMRDRPPVAVGPQVPRVSDRQQATSTRLQSAEAPASFSTGVVSDESTAVIAPQNLTKLPEPLTLGNALLLRQSVVRQSEAGPTQSDVDVIGIPQQSPSPVASRFPTTLQPRVHALDDREGDTCAPELSGGMLPPDERSSKSGGAAVDNSIISRSNYPVATCVLESSCAAAAHSNGVLIDGNGSAASEPELEHQDNLKDMDVMLQAKNPQASPDCDIVSANTDMSLSSLSSESRGSSHSAEDALAISPCGPNLNILDHSEPEPEPCPVPYAGIHSRVPLSAGPSNGESEPEPAVHPGGDTVHVAVSTTSVAVQKHLASKEEATAAKANTHPVSLQSHSGAAKASEACPEEAFIAQLDGVLRDSDTGLAPQCNATCDAGRRITTEPSVFDRDPASAPPASHSSSSFEPLAAVVHPASQGTDTGAPAEGLHHYPQAAPPCVDNAEGFGPRGLKGVAECRSQPSRHAEDEAVAGIGAGEHINGALEDDENEVADAGSSIWDAMAQPNAGVADDVTGDDNELIYDSDCYDNGDSYKGYFCNGLKHGQGTYHFANGSDYQGQWFEGKMHGWGMFTEAQTGDQFEGEWVNGERRFGVYYYANTDMYQGGFVRNRKQGRGVVWERNQMYEVIYDSDVCTHRCPWDEASPTHDVLAAELQHQKGLLESTMVANQQLQREVAVLTERLARLETAYRESSVHLLPLDSHGRLKSAMEPSASEPLPRVQEQSPRQNPLTTPTSPDVSLLSLSNIPSPDKPSNLTTTLLDDALQAWDDLSPGHRPMNPCLPSSIPAGAAHTHTQSTVHGMSLTSDRAQQPLAKQTPPQKRSLFRSLCVSPMRTARYASPTLSSRCKHAQVEDAAAVLSPTSSDLTRWSDQHRSACRLTPKEGDGKALNGGKNARNKHKYHNIDMYSNKALVDEAYRYYNKL